MEGKKKSEVFFSDLRGKAKDEPLGRIEKLMEVLHLKERVKKNSLVAVKIHFGERGNTSYVRPVYVRSIVDAVKKRKGKPFLTDTNTLYVGSRGDSVNHYANALENGFTLASAGAPVIIAGGLRGNRFQEVEVGLTHYNRVEIAPEIADADSLIGISHFKGHEMSGFGGTLKNFGMGSASRQGKLSMHSTASPFVQAKICVGCRTCLNWCAHGALAMKTKKAHIDPEVCTGCGACLPTCPEGAIKIVWDQGIVAMQEKMAEYAYGAIHDRRDRSLFFNFLMNITLLCDCYPFSDTPIVPDIGIVASVDPVAVDQASVDLVNGQAGNPSSALKGNHRPGEDKFLGLEPDVDWSVQLRHAEAIGLGSRDYRLVHV